MTDPPFVPTHTVPEYGLDLRDAPDGTLAPSATLPVGLGVRLLRRQGAWAEVVRADGLTGWVDGRLLLGIAPAAVAAPPAGSSATQPPGMPAASRSATPPTAAPPPVAPPPTPPPFPPPPDAPTADAPPTTPQSLVPPTPAGPPSGPPRRDAEAATILNPAARAFEEPTAELPLVTASSRLAFSPAAAGGILAAIGAFLPWLREPGYYSWTAFDLPITFLVRPARFYEDDPINVGVFVVIVALVGVALSVVAHPISALRRLCGLAVIGCAAATWGQMLRRFDPPLVESFTDWLGVGAYLAVLGGLVLLVAPGPRGSRSR